jgi:DNA-binding NtrC family response regulator
MSGKTRKNILILDPERDTGELFARALETHKQDCKCYWVSNIGDATTLLNEMPFYLVLADITLLKSGKFVFLQTIQAICCDTVVIVDAYVNQKEDIKAAMSHGAKGYFIKPIMVNSLRKLIEEFSPPAPAVEV